MHVAGSIRAGVSSAAVNRPSANRAEPSGSGIMQTSGNALNRDMDSSASRSTTTAAPEPAATSAQPTVKPGVAKPETRIPRPVSGCGTPSSSPSSPASGRSGSPSSATASMASTPVIGLMGDSAAPTSIPSGVTTACTAGSRTCCTAGSMTSTAIPSSKSSRWPVYSSRSSVSADGRSRTQPRSTGSGDPHRAVASGTVIAPSCSRSRTSTPHPSPASSSPPFSTSW